MFVEEMLVVAVVSARAVAGGCGETPGKKATPEVCTKYDIPYAHPKQVPSLECRNRPEGNRRNPRHTPNLHRRHARPIESVQVARLPRHCAKRLRCPQEETHLAESAPRANLLETPGPALSGDLERDKQGKQRGG